MNQEGSRAPATLGDLLYADPAKAHVPEDDWVRLVQSIAAWDQLAMDELFQRTHRVVFTLMLRLLGDPEIAEDATIEVFHDLWVQASQFDPGHGQVLGWVLNQARSRAIERLQAQTCNRIPAVDDFEAHGARLRSSLAGLAVNEQQILENAYVNRSTYHELAAERREPFEVIKEQGHRGLEQLRRAFKHWRAGSMSSHEQSIERASCGWAATISWYALDAVPPEEMPLLLRHLAACEDCRRRIESLETLVHALAFWPKEALRPSENMRERLALRIAQETGVEVTLPGSPQWIEPAWDEVAPGISCKLLAVDAKNDRAGMLVRLGPGVDYPPHTHAGVEELHLLDGELWIDERKLYPGDYNRAESGTSDKRVWSETGCACVLITSTRDVLMC